MSDIRELYQELIIDHGRHPRNFGRLENSTHEKEGYNPLCGDKINVFLNMEKDLVKEVQFQGCGCAISTASASLMTQAIKGKQREDIQFLFDAFHAAVTGSDADTEKLGKLAVLVGVRDYPSRVKCAMLAWYTLFAAMDHSDELVTTE